MVLCSCWYWYISYSYPFLERSTRSKSKNFKLKLPKRQRWATLGFKVFCGCYLYSYLFIFLAMPGQGDCKCGDPTGHWERYVVSRMVHSQSTHVCSIFHLGDWGRSQKEETKGWPQKENGTTSGWPTEETSGTPFRPAGVPCQPTCIFQEETHRCRPWGQQRQGDGRVEEGGRIRFQPM